MSMYGLQIQRGKFEDFKIELWNAQARMQEMQSKADDARREPDTSSSMTAAEWSTAIGAHAAGVSNAENEAREAREKHAEKCREFRDWCSRMRDEIPGILADPPQLDNTDTEPAGWQTLHAEIVECIPSLEVECPTADDPKPTTAGPKAIRTML